MPYSSYHQSYLDRYMETREPHVIGSKRKLEGKRRDGSTCARSSPASASSL